MGLHQNTHQQALAKIASGNHIYASDLALMAANADIEARQDQEDFARSIQGKAKLQGLLRREPVPTFQEPELIEDDLPVTDMTITLINLQVIGLLERALEEKNMMEVNTTFGRVCLRTILRFFLPDQKCQRITAHTKTS